MSSSTSKAPAAVIRILVFPEYLNSRLFDPSTSIVQLPRLTLVVATTVAPVTALEAVTFAPDTVPVDVMLDEPVLIAPDVIVDEVVIEPQEMFPDVIVLPPVLIAADVMAAVFNAPDEVIVPVMFTLPVPVILKEF